MMCKKCSFFLREGGMCGTLFPECWTHKIMWLRSCHHLTDRGQVWDALDWQPRRDDRILHPRVRREIY